MQQLVREKTMTRTSKEQIKIFFLLLPLFKPEAFDYAFNDLGTIFNIGRILSFMIVIFSFIYKKKKPSTMACLIIVMQVWVEFTTIMNAGEIHRAMMVMILTSAMVLLIDLYAKKPQILMRALFVNFEWLIYVNLFTILVFPNGLYVHGVHNEFICYFLGFKNSFFSFCIVAICVAAYNFFILKRTVRPLLLIAASLGCVFLTWSASSIAALTITAGMLAYLAISAKPRIFKKITFPVIYLLSVIISILLSAFNLVKNWSFISDFIVKVLHKSSTLSGRTKIWGLALTMIGENPFIGYGIGEHINWAGYDWYAHNQYLQLLMEGGMINLVLFVILIVLIGKQMKKCKGTFVYAIFLAAFSGLFIFYLVEAGTGSEFFLLYILAYHINSLYTVEQNFKRT